MWTYFCRKRSFPAAHCPMLEKGNNASFLIIFQHYFFVNINNILIEVTEAMNGKVMKLFHKVLDKVTSATSSSQLISFCTLNSWLFETRHVYNVHKLLNSSGSDLIYQCNNCNTMTVFTSSAHKSSTIWLYQYLFSWFEQPIWCNNNNNDLPKSKLSFIRTVMIFSNIETSIEYVMVSLIIHT